jgi:serine/threonine protein phosphatase PrpC
VKYLSIIEPATSEAIKEFVGKRNLSDYLPENYIPPQEDYLLASDTTPIFVVADGVTLNFKKIIEDKKEYPNPSPAGEVAKIFCEAVQKSAQNNYMNLNEETIKKIFKEANQFVSVYNNKIGRSDISGNSTGLYSATGSFVVFSGNKGYWASICDAFFVHFDKDMNLKFMSTGLCSPYAVINGEDKMCDYIESGIINLEEGDIVFVFTDGFEHYIKNQNFVNLFKDWNVDLQNRIKKFSQTLNQENPEKYGHERSLIAIKF